jgi:diacylglycerol kinase family enzyme
LPPSEDRTAREGGGWAAAPAAQRPVLFINPASGGGRAQQAHLDDLARERGIHPVVLTPHQDLAALVDRAVADRADVLGMAGGDGSLATVAAAARAHGLSFVCVPAGTRNHFARDLGVAPTDLAGALDAFTDGLERPIDLGEVNGRLFLNNVSLGIYGDAVHQAGYRGAKLRTLLETAREVLGPSGTSPSTLTLVDDLGHPHPNPAIVLVSNNPYAPARPGARAGRPSLDSGRLGIVVVDRPGDARRPPERAWTASSLAVTASEPVAAGVDGEAVTFAPPLYFQILPAALRVRVAAKQRDSVSAPPSRFPSLF